MSPCETQDWTDAVAQIAAADGTVLILGATDTGKTTLALQAANTAVQAGRRVALLDADIGQGELAPPGTVGVARLEAPIPSLSTARLRAMAFVGDTSPHGHVLPVLQGTRRLLEHCRQRGDDLVIVDASGFVSGRLAEKLQLAQIDLIQPTLVVLLAHGPELQRLASLATALHSSPVRQVTTPDGVRKKPEEYRRTQRINRMGRYLRDARQVDLSAGQVMTLDTWLYSGTPISPWKLRASQSILEAVVLHGEESSDGVFLCTETRPTRARLDLLQEEFPGQRIQATPAALLRGLLVGLIGDGGRLADIGLLEGINFARGILSVITPARVVDDVRALHFGRIRVRRDGTEIGRLTPGDL